MKLLSRIEEIILLAIWKLKDDAYGMPGGDGGGVIYVECGTLVFDGKLTASGEAGGSGTGSKRGGGGGGGGVILVRARRLAIDSGVVAVAGGAGGTGGAGGYAGDGADGFKDVLEVE